MVKRERSYTEGECQCPKNQDLLKYPGSDSTSKAEKFWTLGLLLLQLASNVLSVFRRPFGGSSGQR